MLGKSYLCGLNASITLFNFDCIGPLFYYPPENTITKTHLSNLFSIFNYPNS